MNKQFKLALLSTVFVMVPCAAFAEPVSTVAAISSLLTSAGTFLTSGTLLANLTISAITTAASFGAQALFGRGGSGAVPSQEVRNTIVAPETGAIYAVGRARLAGALFYGNTKSRTKYRLTGLCKGQLDAIEDYYINGVSAVVDSDGTVSSPPWATPSAQYAYIYFKQGTDDLTAYTDLVTPFDEWTTDHRARGVSQLLAKYPLPALASDLYLQLHGKPINVEVEGRFALFYDPREVGHDIDDTSTWEWTDNGVIVAANVMAQCQAFGYGGIDWDQVAIEADKADVLVATKAGTEARAKAGGVFFGTQPGDEVVRQILDSIGAYILPFDGKWQIYLDDDIPTADLTFSDANIIDIISTGGPEGPDRPNICRVKYLSQERNYRESELILDGVAWAQYDDEIAAVGEKPFEIRLPFCPSAAQASRVARRIFTRARNKRGTITTDLTGMAAWSMHYVAASLGEGEAVQVLQNDAPQFDGVNEVTIPFVEAANLAAFVPATDEGDPAPEVPPSEYESTLAKPAAPTQIIQVARTVGGGTEMRIRGADVSPNGLEINYRTYTAGLPNPWVATNEINDFAWVDGDFLGYTIDTRQRQFGGDEFSQLSDVYQTVVGVDNTTPTDPSLSYVPTLEATTYKVLSVDFTASTPLLRVARILVERRVYDGTPAGAWIVAANLDVRPNQDVTGSYSQNAGGSTDSNSSQVRATVYTSNGTPSATITLTVPNTITP
jgi:hypothetical protein